MNRHQRRQLKALGQDVPLENAAVNKTLPRRSYNGFSVERPIHEGLRAEHEKILADEYHKSKPSFYEFLEVLLVFGGRAWQAMEKARKDKERRIIVPNEKVPDEIRMPGVPR